MTNTANKEQGMFTIDLLNGQAVPLKSRPGGIAIVAVTAAIPLIVATAMLGIYLQNDIILSIKTQEETRWDERINKLSGAVEWKKLINKEQAVYNMCLSEVRSSISRHTQWSLVLLTLVENMPDSVVLTGLHIQKHSNKKMVPSKDNPDEMTEIDIPSRTLLIRVRGSSQHDCVQAVKEFGDRLRSSDYLGPKLENITYTQEFDTIEGKEIAFHEIRCIFKPGF
jgi:hypothetical protein